MGQSCNQKQTMISNQMCRDEGHHDALFGMIEMLQALTRAGSTALWTTLITDPRSYQCATSTQKCFYARVPWFYVYAGQERQQSRTCRVRNW